MTSTITHFLPFAMSPEQVQGLWVCLILTLSMAAVCPLLFWTVRDANIQDRAA